MPRDPHPRIFRYPDEKREVSGKIFASWKGRKYGAWGADLSPSKATSELIEAPQHIIDSIFQDELGITSIDAASIDTTTVDRAVATWKFARSLTSADNSLSVIRSICEESALLSMRTSTGIERLVALSNAASPSTTITSSDIALDGVKPLCIKYQTSLDGIANEFYLNYNYNYIKGVYDDQLFCKAYTDSPNDTNLADDSRSNDDGYGATYQALCLSSQTLYNKVIKWEFNADWIRNATTAEAFIKVMMNWLTYRRWIFDATLIYNTNTLTLELGDKVLINHSLLPTGVSNTRQFIVTRLVDGGMSRIGKIDATFGMIPETI